VEIIYEAVGVDGGLTWTRISQTPTLIRLQAAVEQLKPQLQTPSLTLIVIFIVVVAIMLTLSALLQRLSKRKRLKPS